MIPEKQSNNENGLAGDKWVAQEAGCKPATIRVQRHKRLHGLPHWFDVDPVYVGSLPRYRKSDVRQWIETLHGRSQ